MFLVALAPPHPQDPTWRMTMAYDSSQTPPSLLNDATIEELRASLRQYLIDGSSPTTLQNALLRMASEAREKSILPEQLLIVLKGVWSALPEVRAIPDATEQTRMLQRAVTMCITEYYSG